MGNFQINIAQSGQYHRKHKITDADTEKAIEIIDLINKRDKNTPQAGDIIQCVNPETDKIYNRGHLEAVPNSKSFSNICTKPYIPFIFIGSNGIGTDSSGGYWLTCKDSKELVKTGKSKKTFKTWGHCGACEDGAFYFDAIVSVWRYESAEIY